MKYAMTATVALFASLLSGCGGANDPWLDMHEKQAAQQCRDQGLTPDTAEFKSCSQAALAKIQDVR